MSFGKFQDKKLCSWKSHVTPEPVVRWLGDLVAGIVKCETVKITTLFSITSSEVFSTTDRNERFQVRNYYKTDGAAVLFCELITESFETANKCSWYWFFSKFVFNFREH